MKRAKIFLLSIVIAGISAIASAQNQQRSQAPGMGDRLFPMLNRVLTDEQRSSLRSALESQRDKMRPLEEKLRVARKALLDGIAAGKFDENSVRRNAEESARAETELTVLFARVFSEMKPPLSVEQVRQLKSFQPGQAQNAPEAGDAPESHMKLPPPLPRDTNDLPVTSEMQK